MQIANTLGALLVEQGTRVYSGPGKSEGEILQEQIAAMEAAIKADRTSCRRPWMPIQRNEMEAIRT